MTTLCALVCIATLILFGYVYGLMTCGPADWYQPTSPLDLAQRASYLMLVMWHPSFIGGMFGFIGLGSMAISIFALFVGMVKERKRLSRRTFVLLLPQIPNAVSILWGAYWEAITKVMQGDCWQMILVGHAFWIACALALFVSMTPFVLTGWRDCKRIFLCAVPMQLYLICSTYIVVSFAIQKPPL